VTLDRAFISSRMIYVNILLLQVFQTVNTTYILAWSVLDNKSCKQWRMRENTQQRFLLPIQQHKYSKSLLIRLQLIRMLDHPDIYRKIKNAVRDCVHNLKKNITFRKADEPLVYGLDDRGIGVRVPVGPRTFTSPYNQDRL
jgi:hypothetical protein